MEVFSKHLLIYRFLKTQLYMYIYGVGVQGRDGEVMTSHLNLHITIDALCDVHETTVIVDSCEHLCVWFVLAVISLRNRCQITVHECMISYYCFCFTVRKISSAVVFDVSYTLSPPTGPANYLFYNYLFIEHFEMP